MGSIVDLLLEEMQIPLDAWADRRIPKKLFEEHADFTRTERKLFSEHVEQVRLVAQLTPATTRVPPFKDKEYDYSELTLLAMALRQKAPPRIIQMVHAAIPYPTLLATYKENQISLSASKKRLNRTDPTKAQVAALETTMWQDVNSTEFGLLLNALRLPKLHSNNLRELFDDLFTAISLHPLACQLGFYPTKETANEAKELFADILALKNELAQLVKLQQKEKGFGRRVDIHVQIKQMEAEIVSLQAKLKELVE